MRYDRPGLYTQQTARYHQCTAAYNEPANIIRFLYPNPRVDHLSLSSVSCFKVKDDLAQAVCVNCKGQHSAAFKGCSKYQEVSKALKVSVVDKVSYRDAVLKVKSGVL